MPAQRPGPTEERRRRAWWAAPLAIVALVVLGGYLLIGVPFLLMIDSTMRGVLTGVFGAGLLILVGFLVFVWWAAGRAFGGRRR